MTDDGRLLLQVRIAESWIGKILGKSYKGQFELNDGGFVVKDIEEELTLPFLREKSIQNAKEKLGITMTVPDNPQIYLAVYENKEKGIADWAIMFPIPPACWQIPKELLRDVILVDTNELNDLASRPDGQGSLISGWGNRQHRMGLCALWHNTKAGIGLAAYETLKEINHDFLETEYSDNAKAFLAKLRESVK